MERRIGAVARKKINLVSLCLSKRISKKSNFFMGCKYISYKFKCIVIYDITISFLNYTLPNNHGQVVRYQPMSLGRADPGYARILSSPQQQGYRVKDCYWTGQEEGTGLLL